MKKQQREYLFERFCQSARYIPLLEKYAIICRGKRLSSYDTEDLFKQYIVASR